MKIKNWDKIRNWEEQEVWECTNINSRVHLQKEGKSWWAIYLDNQEETHRKTKNAARKEATYIMRKMNCSHQDLEETEKDRKVVNNHFAKQLIT